MPSDKEIRKLCAKVLEQAEDVEAFAVVLAELKAAIREHFASIETGGIHMVPKLSKVRDRAKKSKVRELAKSGTTG